jgi:copper ion binding protein
VVTTRYQVKGMTCDHCVRAVSAEVGAIDGVLTVVVDLPSGDVTVTSAWPLDDAAVVGAVKEAGYEVEV